jgi:hypothetical protein
MPRNKLRPLYPPKYQRKKRMPDQPAPEIAGAQPVNVPIEFLAEHGRVSLENAQLRNVHAQQQQTIQLLLDKLREATSAPEEGESVKGLPIVRRKPTVVGHLEEGATEATS